MRAIDLVTDGDAAFVAGELLGIKTTIHDGIIDLFAYTDIEICFLKNYYEKLSSIGHNKFTPHVYNFSEGDFAGKLTLEHLGESESVTDEIAFRRNCALLLYTLKKHGIRHGDISTKNIIVKNNKPMLIDFHQSKFNDEPGLDKRPEGDAFNLWKAALELSPDTSRHIRKWQAIRPFIKRAFLFDLGCAEGDYLLFAFVEKNEPNMFWGIDHNLDALEVAKNLWPGSGFGFHLEHKDILDSVITDDCNVLMLSVYAHLLKKHSKIKVDAFIKKIVSQSAQFFFETQLYGDGPGPEFFQTDGDVYRFLKQFGEVKKLVTIPVFGRDANRSVWRIT